MLLGGRSRFQFRRGKRRKKPKRVEFLGDHEQQTFKRGQTLLQFFLKHWGSEDTMSFENFHVYALVFLKRVMSQGKERSELKKLLAHLSNNVVPNAVRTGIMSLFSEVWEHRTEPLQTFLMTLLQNESQIRLQSTYGKKRGERKQTKRSDRGWLSFKAVKLPGRLDCDAVVCFVDDWTFLGNIIEMKVGLENSFEKSQSDVVPDVFTMELFTTLSDRLTSYEFIRYISIEQVWGGFPGLHPLSHALDGVYTHHSCRVPLRSLTDGKVVSREEQEADRVTAAGAPPLVVSFLVTDSGGDNPMNVSVVRRYAPPGAPTSHKMTFGAAFLGCLIPFDFFVLNDFPLLVSDSRSREYLKKVRGGKGYRSPTENIHPSFVKDVTRRFELQKNLLASQIRVNLRCVLHHKAGWKQFAMSYRAKYEDKKKTEIAALRVLLALVVFSGQVDLLSYTLDSLAHCVGDIYRTWKLLLLHDYNTEDVEPEKVSIFYRASVLHAAEELLVVEENLNSIEECQHNQVEYLNSPLIVAILCHDIKMTSFIVSLLELKEPVYRKLLKQAVQYAGRCFLDTSNMPEYHRLLLNK